MIRAVYCQVSHSIERLRSRLGPRRELYQELERQIEHLAPWYQPIDFGGGVHTYSKDKGGGVHGVDSLDRGLAKWHAFVRPNLPFGLTNRRVLELGCNAGLFLIECVREGAREAIGVERDAHYFEQAQFVASVFSRLRGEYFPVRVFQGEMENFGYELLGRFDLALLLASIYHIGKPQVYGRLAKEEIFSLQVNTIRAVAAVADYLLFQGNPKDEKGRGDGPESLRLLVREAGLELVKESFYEHHRGYILLARSPVGGRQLGGETFPIGRMVNKLFLRAAQSAECELANLIAVHGSNGFDVTETRYYRLRTGGANWVTPGMAQLPGGLERAPTYWVMPWACKPRRLDQVDHVTRVRHFKGLLLCFEELFESLQNSGFDVSSGSIPGYKLVHPDYGEVFQYIDGNQRMGILAHLAAENSNLQVPVETRQVIRRERLLDYPLTRQLIEEGYFTERDAFRWFDQAFWFLRENEWQ